MISMPLSVQSVWACSILGQLITLTLLPLRRNASKIPFFATYIVLNLCQAGFMLVLVFIPTLSPAIFAKLSWCAEGITLLAQAVATTEILGLTLRPYPGIWGLAWRALATVSALVVLIVGWLSHARGIEQLSFQLNRGYHITFSTAVIACLALVRYYSIRVPSAFKMILAGFCLNSCVEVLVNTLIQVLFHKGYAVHQTAWLIVNMLSFVAALTIWIVALWKPFPVDDRQIASPSDSAYRRLSPEINERLREINEKLLRLWKLEARAE